MMRFATWKVVTIILGPLIAALIVLPSLLSPGSRAALDRILPSPAKTIVLGLDLQGGAHLLLEVDSASVTRTQVDNLRDDARRLMRENEVKMTGGVGVQGRGVQFRVPDPTQRDKIVQALRNQSNSLGSTLTGAVQDYSVNNTADDGLVQVQLTDAGIANRVHRAVDQSIEVLRRRIDASGTKEPTIQREGNDRILVEVPGLQDTQHLKDLLGTTAKLEFRLVGDPGANPSEVEQLPFYKNSRPGTEAVEKRVMVQGEDLTDAQPGFDQRTGEPVVNFRFNLRGGQQFGQVTAENVGKPFAIVLDNQIVSDPRILGAITGGSGQISGNFTVTQANDLSVLLRAGALPAKLTVVEERTVGPGLGQDSIDAGERASLVAAVLVVGYMLVTYGTFGIFADIALAVHILLIFAAMVLLGATLTLPGIAGIVLTIGMAVDANVLIYERIREEHHNGRSIIASLDSGFKRAFATIVDSNVTLFVAALILYLFGSGPVRGFAVSLGLGILTSIVTAVTMTRMMIAVWYRAKRPQQLPI